MNATLMTKRAPAKEAPPKTNGNGASAASPHTLSTYIQSRFDECSRSQKDVAQYIIDHLDEAAFQTAEELARRANTSSSTVVRFSQALGFEGFPELQRAAREEYRRAHAGAGESPLFSVERSDFETAIAADHANVEETARKATPANVERAIAAISGASRIVIAGTDQMAFFASYLRHLLMLLDLRAELVASPSQEALGRLARIDSETLVIALSAGRPRARRSGDEARPSPPGEHDRDHRRDDVRGREARADQALLLVEQPDLRALAHRAAEHDPGARLWRLLARRRAVRRSDQGVPLEVGAAVLAPALPRGCALARLRVA
jgi:hypothetical protein